MWLKLSTSLLFLISKTTSLFLECGWQTHILFYREVLFCLWLKPFYSTSGAGGFFALKHSTKKSADHVVVCTLFKYVGIFIFLLKNSFLLFNILFVGISFLLNALLLLHSPIAIQKNRTFLYKILATAIYSFKMNPRQLTLTVT